MSHHPAKRPSESAAAAVASSPAAKRARAPSPSSPAFSTKKEEEAPDLTRILCDILASTPADDVESALDKAADIRRGGGITTGDVERVLRSSYAYPHAAAAFFHWAGHRHLGDDGHSPYSWNLLVDILGKSRLFARMWDTVSSMHSRRLLSLSTFASVFSSLAAAAAAAASTGGGSGSPSPLQVFLDVMPRYGVARDTAALNTLLSALCVAGRLDDARAAVPVARAEARARPDADSYAILLEACEAAADPGAAREVFDEMARTVGLDPANVPAYDSFLTTLVSSDSATGLQDAMQYLDVLNRHGCCPGAGEKFFRAALAAHLQAGELRGATYLWDKFVGRPGGVVPDVEMYNTMIMLQGSLGGDAEVILDYVDDMIVNGVFPDANTYNVVLQLLLKRRELGKAAAIFSEMVKNECWPNEGNCSLALGLFLDAHCWETGVKVWSCVVENGLPPLEECGNMLVSKLKDDRLPEACKYAEDMVDRGIKLSSSTLSSLKQCLQKVKKGDIYDQLLRKMEGTLVC